MTAIGSLGGAIFISEDATITMSNSQLTNNQAEYGASIIYQSVQSGPQKIENITLSFDLDETDLSTAIQSQIRSDSDGLSLKNFTISALKTPFLSHSAGTIEIDGIDMTALECTDSDNSLTFCLFDFEVKEGQVLIGEISNVQVTDIYSDLPLIVSVGSNLTFSTLSIQDVESTASVSVASIDTSIANFDALTLINIDSVWMTTSESILTISNSEFDNQDKVNAGSKTLTQFIVSSLDEVDISSTSFSYNSALYPTNGGVNLDFRAFSLIFLGTLHC